MKQIYDKNYTLSQSGYQLILPLNLDCIIPSDDKVRLLSQFVEELDLTDLYHTYDRVRKSSATPKQMLKVVLYARLSNGPIESINRAAKDIRRIGRGYRNFEHFRNRFLYGT